MTVENEYIGIAKEVDEWVVGLFSLWTMLGVGRIDYGFAMLFEAVAPGVTRVLLLDGSDGDVIHLKRVTRCADIELNVCLHRFIWYGETRARHLRPDRLLDCSVKTVEDDSITWDVGWSKKGKALNVVPMQVGYKYVVGLEWCICW